MSLYSVVGAVIRSIEDLSNDWYDLPDHDGEAIPNEDEPEGAERSCTEFCGGREAVVRKLPNPKTDRISGTIRTFVRYVYYSHSLLLRSAGLVSGGSCPSDMNSAAVKEGLRVVMGECRTLRDEPHMFSSIELKEKFQLATSILVDAMLSIEKLRKELLEIKEQVYSPVTDMHQPFSSLLLQTPVVFPMPAFLPDKLHGKHPWNNWLDNSAQSTTGWVAIQQKLPRTGEKLMRQLSLLYDVVQDQFEEEAVPEVFHESNDKVPSPGDTFRHMTWSGFCTLPRYNLGFKNGKRKEHDFNGITTLEHFSERLRFLYKGNGMELGTDNCPYFRFAMAYTKL
ncbi:uncharacterized protein RSE6_12116 [Rhynchosporium secalis]|uniref:Uncharacterized protein n=1 Tax=Rhynchosporium secalis TaxID=38038 RepID=A0A1E1MPM3_RHYSE|nr:uncharacterized protein RSE6_12116 [Rhynchosporium secalis]